MPKLIAPPSGIVSCSYGNRFGSNCSFTCRNGYSIRGSVHRQCEAEQGKPPAYWTGNDTHCESMSVIFLLCKYQSIDQSVNRSVNELVSHSFKFVSRPTNQLVSQASNQLVGG